MNDSERKAFWDMLCSLDGQNSEHDINKLKETIKYPAFIYRYRPITVYNIDALQNNKLYFSLSSYYDDPFDTYLNIDYKSIYEQLVFTESSKKSAVEVFKQFCLQCGDDEKTIEKKVKEINATSTKQFFDCVVSFLTQVIQPRIRNTSMSVCFSESGLNETMWLKYANQYEGFCLMYNVNNDKKILCSKQDKCQNCSINKFGTPLYPMYYSETRYNATKYAFNLAREYFGRIYPDFILRYLPYFESCAWEKEKVTLIKSKCHEYDAEWRMIIPCSINEPVMCEWIPYGVILGLRTSEKDKRIIIDSARKAGIQHLYQSVISLNGTLEMLEL